MMKRQFPSIVSMVIVAYCAFHSKELLVAWRDAPLERYSWVIFLVWLFPLALLWKRGVKESPCLLCIALFVSLLGSLTDLNALHYLSFALAIAAFIPWTWGWVPWVIVSISWMPAAGWISSHFALDYVFALRLLVAFLGALCLIVS